jgi:hypothetical protein
MDTHGVDLCFMSARDLATLIRTKRVSAREVMAAHLERINRVNPTINAIVAKLDGDVWRWQPPPTSGPRRGRRWGPSTGADGPSRVAVCRLCR